MRFDWRVSEKCDATLGYRGDQVKQIGNAVPVHESKALVVSAMEAA